MLILDTLAIKLLDSLMYAAVSLIIGSANLNLNTDLTCRVQFENCYFYRQNHSRVGIDKFFLMDSAYLAGKTTLYWDYVPPSVIRKVIRNPVRYSYLRFYWASCTPQRSMDCRIDICLRYPGSFSIPVWQGEEYIANCDIRTPTEDSINTAYYWGSDIDSLGGWDRFRILRILCHEIRHFVDWTESVQIKRGKKYYMFRKSENDIWEEADNMMEENLEGLKGVFR